MRLVVYLKHQTIKSPIYDDNSDNKATMMAVAMRLLNTAAHLDDTFQLT